MKRSKELEIILDECLERLFAGGTVEECLERFPAHAEELKPLLETAAGTSAAVDITPRPEFRQQAYNEFQAAIREMPAPRKQGFIMSLRPRLANVIIIVAVIAALFGTSAASASSLPDSPLYSVKLATENVRIALTFSDEGKAELYNEFAAERVEEILVMAEQGKVEGIEKATENLNNQLIAMADVVMDDHGAGTLMMAESTTMDGTMQESFVAAPEGAAPPAQPGRESNGDITTGSAKPNITVTQPPQAAVPEPAPSDTVGKSGILRSQDAAFSVASDGTQWAGNGDDMTLREEVLNNSQTANIRIIEALENAPEDVKEALIEALNVLNNAYSNVISNMR